MAQSRPENAGFPQIEGVSVASIQKRTWIDKKGRQCTSYRVQIRRLGFPDVTKTFKRKTVADKWATATETDIDRRTYFPQHEAERHTVGDLVDRQLETIKVNRPHDHPRHEAILEHWKERLGAYTLATPSLSDLIGRERDRLQVEYGLAPATVNRYLASLSVAFSNAVQEWKWLPHSMNPMPSVTKKPEPKGRVRFLSDEERTRLLDACRQSEYKPLYLMVLFALTTGMRRGELLGLRWTDMDLERHDKHGNPAPIATLKNTKNGDTRSVPVIPEVVTLLTQHGKVRKLGNAQVFVSDGASEIWSFDKAWYAALKAAKVTDFRWHDLRHSAASYVAMSHGTLSEIAALLGHRQLSMVARYSHLTDQHVGEVVQRMTKKYFQ
jgi:integrase